MYFELVKSCPRREGELIYIKDDYSIDFIPNQGGGYNLVLAYLNLIFDSETKCATQVWGFHPHTRWIQQPLLLPDIQSGSFIFFDETIKDYSDIVRIENSLNWETFYDSQKEWLCIGNMQRAKDDVAVEFATNTVAVLSQKQLKALWLKPTICQRHP